MLIGWIGFLGSWLLVAGPLFQGVIELREQEVDREGFASAAHGITPPAPPSLWWWLLPPVRLWLRRRSNEAYRREVRARLTPDQRHQFNAVFEKATGWFVVASGAVLLATKETWGLREQNHWPIWVFVLLLVLPLALSLGVAVAQLAPSHQEEPVQEVLDADVR